MHDEDQQSIPRLERGAILLWERLHLARRNDALRFRADIYEEFILIHPHDRAINSVAVLEVAVVVSGVDQELLHERTIFSLLGLLTVWRAVGGMCSRGILLVGRGLFLLFHALSLNSQRMDAKPSGG